MEKGAGARTFLVEEEGEVGGVHGVAVEGHQPRPLGVAAAAHAGRRAVQRQTLHRATSGGSGGCGGSGGGRGGRVGRCEGGERVSHGVCGAFCRRQTRAHIVSSFVCFVPELLVKVSPQGHLVLVNTLPRAVMADVKAKKA